MGASKSRKRKERGDQVRTGSCEKRPRREETTKTIPHVVLVQYYAKIQTLREYILAKLPQSSKIRRKKLASVGLDASSKWKAVWSEEELALATLLDTTLVATRRDDGVNSEEEDEPEDPDRRWELWLSFSQRGDESHVTLSDGNARGSIDAQSEIVDFVVWLLFSRLKKGSSWGKHQLCDGFKEGKPKHGQDATMLQSHGIFPTYPNDCVRALKESPWPQLLTLLGRAGERIMLDLLVDCAIFGAVKAGKGNLCQLSGVPISELDSLATVQATTANHAPTPSKGPGAAQNVVMELRPSEITFVKSRMMYARAALNAHGLVHFGLRHIHVLNRFPRIPPSKFEDRSSSPGEAKPEKPDESVIHIMMYMFPRQFGLHNVFTSTVDRKQTAQKFQDYTLREEEIAKKFPKTVDGQAPVKHIPKRLRGSLPHLIRKLQILHSRCSYAEMLQHYCPAVGSSQNGDKHLAAAPQRATQAPSDDAQNSQDGDDAQPTQNRSLVLNSRHGNIKPVIKKRKKARRSTSAPEPEPVELQYNTLIELANPIPSISAFCQAVLSKIIPNDFWGQGTTQEHNKSSFLKKVHQFICLRRFESMRLHELMQGMKISDIEWLTPPSKPNTTSHKKSCQSDTRKRTEIFYEFLYYLFDSLLIPLIRSNFYVTESNTHRYRLFFFRQDIWRQIADPAMALLKTKMLEEVARDDALRVLDSRKLGFSQVRLLPKQAAMRPIMNLRRRTTATRGKKVLRPSINTVLAPVSTVLKLEKALHPERLGAAMFSVGDVYSRIKEFKARVFGKSGKKKLYFAKVDVQAAFDTIPQDAMVDLVKTIPRQKKYKVAKHAEVKPVEGSAITISVSSRNGEQQQQKKVYKRWHSVAKLVDDDISFLDSLDGDIGTMASKRKDTVFVGSTLKRIVPARELVALTASHVKQNLVRIGKKFYRQKTGIPQGSVLSATLCNYFYADLEAKHLGFLDVGDSLLLRLIDDFLLVTTDRHKAERFVEVMYAGLPEYGVNVKLEKSLVSFDMRIAVDGQRVPNLLEGKRRWFPYCGLLIDVDTLDVANQRDCFTGGAGAGKKDSTIFDSITVEFSRCPGQNFKRKVLNAFKIQSHLMFFDTSHNSSQSIVLANAYTAFVETAIKMWAYARCLPKQNKPSLSVMRDTLSSLVDVAYLLLTSRSRKARYPGYVCSVRKGQLAWLVLVAFRSVLVRKQAGYGGMIRWLDDEVRKLSTTVKGKARLSQLDCKVLVGVVEGIGAQGR